MRKKPVTRTILCALFALLLVVGVGCGSSSDDSSSSSGDSGAETTAASGGESGGSDVQAQLAEYYEGVFGELPKSGPKAVPGKDVWIISLSQAAAGAKLPSDAAAEAAKAIGWTPTIFDGKGDFARMAEGVDAAVAAGADGVIVVAADCGQLKASLERATDAGVKTFGLLALDCDDKYGGSGEPLFSGTVAFAGDGTYGSFLEETVLPMQGAWSVAKAEEEGGSVIYFTETDNAIMRYSKDGLSQTVDELCPSDCYEYSMTFADVLAGKLAAKISAALAQHPDASVVALPYDAAVTAGGLEAVASSGRPTEISLIGAGGSPENYDLIRSGKQGATVAVSPRWEGWAGVDGLNRAFAEQEQVPSGLGAQIVDQEHNLPAAGEEYEVPVDFQGNYERIWGIGG